eukprot:RCo015631
MISTKALCCNMLTVPSREVLFACVTAESFCLLLRVPGPASPILSMGYVRICRSVALAEVLLLIAFFVTNANSAPPAPLGSAIGKRSFRGSGVSLQHELSPLSLPCSLSVSGFSGSQFILNGLFDVADYLYLGRPCYFHFVNYYWYFVTLWYDPTPSGLGWTFSSGLNSTDKIYAYNAQNVSTPD